MAWNENCVIRMGGLGDLAILSSSLLALAEKEPWRPLVLATLPHNVPLLIGAHYLSRVIPIEEAEKEKWFKVYDCRWGVEPPNIGPGRISWEDYIGRDRSDNFDRLLGVNGKKNFSIPVCKKALEEVKPVIDALPRPLVAFAPTSKSPVRCVPPEYVHPIASTLVKELGVQIVLVGKTEAWSKQEAAYSGFNILNMIDLMSVKETVALLSLMDLVISPDTAIYHLAAALNRPCLALFGNIHPNTRTTYYPTVRSLYPEGELDCHPCWDVPRVCQRQPGVFGSPCMRLFTPTRILEAVKEML